MDIQVYWAEKVATTKQGQCQMHLNRAWQVSTTWSDADRQRATQRLEFNID